MSSPQNGGFAHIIPVLAIAVILVGIAAVAGDPQRGLTKTSVLSENSGSGSGSSGSGSSGSGSDDDGSTSPTPDDKEDEGDLENEIQDEIEANRKVEVENENGKIKAKLRVGNQTRELEIKPDETRLRFKVEENGIENSVDIRIEGDRFVIKHEGVEAQTKFPLTLDPATNTLQVNTPAGLVNVVTLPGTAVENMLATGKFDEARETEIEENDNPKTEFENKLLFRAKGVNHLKLFGLIPVSVPVESSVGAQTGEVLEVREPVYLRLLRFLFTE